MAPKKRQQGTSLIDRLFNEYYRFSFFIAVHLLEHFYHDKKPLGTALSPHKEAMRFFVRPGFAFPPSDIANLQQDNEDGPVHMEVTFMGLIGPSGVLPHWYNELALERARQKDHSLTAFFDIFHHRLISLFYLAWKKSRLAVNYQIGAKDKVSRYFLSLMGLGTSGLSDRIGLPEESLIYYSGLLSRPIPSAMAIESAVGYFSGAKAQVEQFIDRVIPFAPEDQTHIGSANTQLGVDTVCGSYTWENQTKFRINLGPMNYSYFIRFLPSGDMLNSIFFLVRYMVGIEYEFEIRLFLKREDVPLCTLGMGTAASSMLGWTTWLKTPGIINHEDPYVTLQEADL